ncbi:hypothetical protein [Methylobacterium fujisawaense]
MAFAQHTPGPWQIEGRFQPPGSANWGFIITAGTNDRQDGPAARVGDLMVSEADALLIAAAPDLLQAGKHLAVKLAEAYRIAKCDPAKCQAIADFMAAVANVEGR